jgi:RND family efflux transporter MFP subunit
MKKIILIVLLIILIAAGVTLLKKRRQTIAEAPVATPITYTVKTVLPETKTVSQTSTFLARLESANSAGISSKLSGRISELLVRESRKVRQGDLLVRIDDQEIRASIDALQAKLASARKQRDYSETLHARNKALFEAGGLAQEKLEASEVTYSAAAAAVKELEQNIRGLKNQLDYSNIRAPFAGIVGTIFLRQGDLATPGRPILTLNSLPQKLTFNFMPGPEDIQPGQDVLLQGIKAGKIATLYNDAKAGLWVAEVTLDRRLDQPNGSYLTIEVVTKAASGCGVPVQALLHREQGESIMFYQGDHFEEKSVNVKVQGKKFALIDPCVSSPVAVASEAKLSLLPTYGSIRISSGGKNE